jgi:hypothetical protein
MSSMVPELKQKKIVRDSDFAKAAATAAVEAVKVRKRQSIKKFQACGKRKYDTNITSVVN